MLKTFLLGGALVAVVAGAAFADSATNNPPPAPPQDQQAQQAQDGGPQGWWGPMRHGWRHQRGMMMGQAMGMMGGPDGPGGPRGPGGPGPMGGPGASGFHLTLGNGAEVGIMCGRQSLKDCIADAQPLIDAAKAAPAKTQ